MTNALADVTRRFRVVSALSILMVLAVACDPEQPGAEYGQEGAVEQEEKTTEATQPEAEEPQAATEDRPARRRTAEESAVVPGGTELRLTLEETVSTESHEEGDRFSAEIDDEIRDEAGRVLIPRGTSVEGVVAESRRSAGADEQAVLALQLDSIEVAGERHPLAATVQDARPERTEGDTGAETAAKIAIGTAAGAMVGQILGESTESALGGAAAGAAAGAVVALTTREGDATLEEGSVITIRLNEPLRLDPDEVEGEGDEA